MALRLPDILAAGARGLKAGVEGFDEAHMEVRREAELRAKALASQVDALTSANQGRAALGLLPQLGEARRQSTGVRPPSLGIQGGALPGGERDFNTPSTLRAIRAEAGLPRLQAPKLEEVSAGATLFDPVTGRAVFRAPFAPSSGLSFEQRLALQRDRQGFDLRRDQARQDNAARGRPTGGESSAAKALVASQVRWDAAAKDYIEQELRAADARHRAEGSGGGDLPPPPGPNATPEERRDYGMAVMSTRLLGGDSGSSPGLPYEERQRLREKFLLDFARSHGPRPTERTFVAPGRTAAGPLAPDPQ